MDDCVNCDCFDCSSNCCSLDQLLKCCCPGDHGRTWPYLCLNAPKDCSQCCCCGNEKEHRHTKPGHNTTTDALTAFEPLVMGARVVVGTKSAPRSTSSDRRPRL